MVFPTFVFPYPSKKPDTSGPKKAYQVPRYPVNSARWEKQRTELARKFTKPPKLCKIDDAFTPDKGGKRPAQTGGNR